MPIRQKTIYVAILNQGDIRTDLAQVINVMIQNDSYRLQLTYPAAKPITNNRNTIVQKFLATDCDYLMMVDSDIVPPINILNLADFDKDIITPLMFVKQKGMLIPLFLKRNRDGMYDAADYLGKVGLQEVDATGTGCIIIKREVVEEMKHLFKNRYDEDGIKVLGNDFAFCQDAKKLGFRVWVHLDYVAGHHSTQDLKDEFYEQLGKYRIEREMHFLKEALKGKPMYKKLMRDVKEKALLKVGND
jgi:hypothetical protein|tara:strand:- start:2906 stop:3640 length:735 start_codon:yes stop_codon:yes gene_type:complete